MKQFLIAAFVLIYSNCFATYYSQYGQDKFVNENYFRGYDSGGIFVEIGAHDGITNSNTYFFEQKRWKGICVEPIPQVFAELKKNRNCTCIQGCIADNPGENQFVRLVSPCVDIEMRSGLVDKYDQQHIEKVLSEIKRCGGAYELLTVKCHLLNDILDENSISQVDFLSIDIQGGEFDILSSIDFDRFQINVITVEDSYNDQRCIPFLEQKGFNFVKRIRSDLVFVNKNFTGSRQENKGR